MARDPGKVAHRPSAHGPDPGRDPGSDLGRDQGRDLRPDSGPDSGPPPDTPRTDYTGAIYGSLLAASVVAGAGALGPHPRVELMALLLCTGVVFWGAHAYVRFVGNRLRHQSVTWREIRQVCAREWPIVQAALLPAVAVAISPLLGLGVEGAGWLALGVAVTQQVGWATAMVIRAGASRGAVASVAAVNLVLGLIIVAAKVALH